MISARALAWCLALASLAGCDNHADRDRFRGVVSATLKDPSSAQFRDDRVVRLPDGSARYCGEVNARNAFGGYVGFRPFIADDNGVAFLPPDDSTSAHQAFRVLWANNCSTAE